MERFEKYTKRITSMILLVATLITLWFNDNLLSVSAEENVFDQYIMVLNDTEKFDTTEKVVHISYGEATEFTLQDADGNTLNTGSNVSYLYSETQGFYNSQGDWVGNDILTTVDFSKATYKVDNTYYICAYGMINNVNGSNISGDYAIYVDPATISAPSITSTSNYVISWNAPATAENGSALDDGTITGYTITLIKGSTEITLDEDKANLGSSATSVDLSDEIKNNGYGTYSVTVTAIAETSSGNYVNSAPAQVSDLVYKDTTVPTFDTAPSFDSASQKISMTATDSDTGIAAFAITTATSLEETSEEWVRLEESEIQTGATGADKLYKEFTEDDEAGTYYCYVMDKHGNITKYPSGITLKKITYIGNASDVEDSVCFFDGESQALKTPVRDGYTGEWYSNEELTEKADSTANASETVYAKWTYSTLSFTTAPSDQNLTYTGLDQSITVVMSSSTGLTFTWYRKNGDDWEVVSGMTGATLTVKNVADSGTYKVFVSQTTVDGDTSDVESGEFSVAVQKAKLTLAVDSTSITYRDSEPTYTYQITGFVNDETTASDGFGFVEGTIMASGTSKGSNTLTASGFSANNYYFVYETGTLTVGAKDVTAEGSDVTVSLGIPEGGYAYAEDGGIPVAYEPAVTVMDGDTVVPAEEYEVSYNNNAKAGTANVTVTFNKNYTGSLTKDFTINKATFTSTVSMSDWTYAGTASTPGIDVNPGGGSVTYYYKDQNGKSLGTTRPSNAGEYYVYAVIGETDNYQQVTTADTAFTIHKITITITADSGSWEYDGNTHVLDHYTQEGEFAGADEFQSVQVSGSITTLGSTENVITYTFSPDVNVDNYEIVAVNGTLTITESTLQTPSYPQWSTGSSKIGCAEWVRVVKTNVVVTYQLQLYRVSYGSGSDGVAYTKLGDPVTTTENTYNFRSTIYADAAEYYKNAAESDHAIGYTFTIKAIPTGGDAAANYVESAETQPEDVAYVGAAPAKLTTNVEEGIYSLSVSRYFGMDGTFLVSDVSDFIVLEGETLQLEAQATSAYKLSASDSTWAISNSSGAFRLSSTGGSNPSGGGNTDDSINDGWIYSTLASGKNSVAETVSSVRLSIMATPVDRAPVIGSFTGALDDTCKTATLNFTASDGKEISGWQIIRSDTSLDDTGIAGIKPAKTDANWKTSGISSDKRTVTSSEDVTQKGYYYLFVKDNVGNVSGGNVVAVYQISFAKGNASATGSMDSLLKIGDQALKLPEVGFSYTGQSFKNWTTKDGAVLEDEASYVLNQDDTLTATWTGEVYTYTVKYHYQEIVYDSESGTFSEVTYPTDEESIESAQFTASYGATVDITQDDYKKILKSKQGYSLDTASDKNQAVTITGNGQTIDLYYALNTYQVSYSYTDATGANQTLTPDTYYFGQKLVAKDAPTCPDGYEFSGWSYGELGAMPETMPTYDIEATGSMSKMTVNYYVVVYSETLTQGEFTLTSESYTYSALQDDEITFSTGDLLGYVGWDNSYVRVFSGEEAATHCTDPGDKKTSATGTVTATAGSELYFALYRTRETHTLTLNVWKGDRLDASSEKIYTMQWSFRTGETINADYYATYGYNADDSKNQWKIQAAAGGADGTGDPVDLTGLVLAKYVDWSTDTAPSTMPGGDVVVTREYVTETLYPYYVDVYLENADGTYTEKTSLLYYDSDGATVTADPAAIVADNSVSALRYYEYNAASPNASEELTGTVVATDTDADRLHLSVYYERKSYDVKIIYYNGSVLKTETVSKVKWGHTYTFDPDKYFDYSYTSLNETLVDRTGESGSSDSFRDKSYVVSYQTYYWWQEDDSYNGGSGYYSHDAISTSADLKKDYSVKVGKNDENYAHIYYMAPGYGKTYMVNVGYNPSNLQKATDEEKTFNQFEITADNGSSYKIRLANKKDLYEYTVDGGEDSDYPGVANKNGTYTYGNLKEGYSLVTVTAGGNSYEWPVDSAGYIYIPMENNPFYYGNTFSLNYNNCSYIPKVDGAGIGYSSNAVAYLTDYKSKYGPDAGDNEDTKGANFIWIYNPGYSPISGLESGFYNYTFTYHYANTMSITYSIEGSGLATARSCSNHYYTYYDPVTTIGCSHSGIFPDKTGYEIHWYTDSAFTTEAEPIDHIRESITLYGRYEKEIKESYAYLVYPMLSSITVDGKTYGTSLTLSDVEAIKAANDSNYAVTEEIETRTIEVKDTASDLKRTSTYTATTYKINGEAVLCAEPVPTYTYTDVELNPSKDFTIAEGFQFDDTRTENKLKGYVQTSAISLYAYCERKICTVTVDRQLSDTDNVSLSSVSYGSTFKLPALGYANEDSTKDTSKTGYTFDGWKFYKDDGTEVTATSLSVSTYTDGDSHEAYQFKMPSYDVKAVAQWKPAGFDYTIYHYFQTESETYEATNVQKMAAAEEEVTATAEGVTATNGLTLYSANIVLSNTTYAGIVYKNGENFFGASFAYENGTKAYFSAATETQGKYLVTDAKILAMTTQANLANNNQFTSESTYSVDTYLATMPSSGAFSFAYAQYQGKGSTATYTSGASFTAYPDMQLNYYYSRKSDYQITAAVVSMDGGATGTTVTGTGKCFYGEDATITAVLAEGYVFDGWYEKADVYDEDGNFLGKTVSYKADQSVEGLKDASDNLISPVSTDLSYTIHVESSYDLIAVVHPSEVQSPDLSISGPSSLTYGYAYSSGNTLTVLVDLSKVDGATYIKSYQWSYSTDGGSTWQTISGATTPYYTIESGLSAGSYEYKCSLKVARKDNGREKSAEVTHDLTVTKASLNLAGSSSSNVYDGKIHHATITFKTPANSDAAQAAGLVFYYSLTTELTADNYATAGTSFTKYSDYYSADASGFKDVAVDGSGNVTAHVVYFYVVDSKGNYEPTSFSSSFTITPIELSLEPTSKAFHRTYDATTDISGSITDTSSDKYEIATGGYYKVVGMLDRDADTSLIDFTATFNDAHVKNASGIRLSGVKVVFKNTGSDNYNYKFADSYQIDISGYIDPYPIEATWGTEDKFVYNGSAQGPTASLVEGQTAPNTGLTITVTGKQKNANTGTDTYTANMEIADSTQDPNNTYYSSDYKITAPGKSYQIVAKMIYVIPVDVTDITYDGENHTFTEISVFGYSNNDKTSTLVTGTAGSKEGLITGHTIQFSANKSYMDAGTYKDLQATDIKIYDENGKTVTSNYKINLGKGTLTIKKREIVLSGIGAKDKSYDGTTASTLVYTDSDGKSIVTFNGLVEGDSLSIDTSKFTGTFAAPGVANDVTVTIQFTEDALTGTSLDNYYLNTDDLYTTADITPPGITVKADSKTSVYGENIAFTVQYEGFVNGVETVSGTPVYRLYTLADDGVTKNYLYTVKTDGKIYDASDSEVHPSVGIYNIEVVPTNADNTKNISTPNYEISWDSTATQTLTVTQRPITASTKGTVSKDYDASTDAASLFGSGEGKLAFSDYYELGAVSGDSASGLVSGDTVNLSFTEAVYNDADCADADKVTFTGLAIDNSNYELKTETMDATGEIKPLALTIAAYNYVDGDTDTDHNAFHYGDAITDDDGKTVFGCTCTGFLASEETAESAKVTFTSTYDPSDTTDAKRKVGDYTVTPVYTNSNYDITISSGNLRVDPKPVSVKPVAAANIQYGITKTLPDISYSFSGFCYSQTADAVITSTSGGQTAAEKLTALTGWTNVTCGCTGGKDQLLEALPDADGYSLTYDASVISALTADNYTFEGADGTIVVEKQAIVIAGIRVNDKVYDGTTAVAAADIDVSAATVTYYVNGELKEAVALSSSDINGNYTISAAYSDKNVSMLSPESTRTVQDKTVTLTITLTGDVAEKYSFATTSQTTATAKIKPASLTLTAKEATIFFGAKLPFDPNKPGDFATAVGFVNSESFSDLKGTMTYVATGTESPYYKYDAGSPAGRYKIEIGGFTETANYDITFNNSAAKVLTIDPATLETPAPVWDTTSPGTVNWAAIPNIGTLDRAGSGSIEVDVDHYEIALYKDGASEPVTGSKTTVTYAAGLATYSYDYSSLIRQNGAGTYTVKVQAFASTTNNTSYCNVNEESGIGTTTKALPAAKVYVTFADDTASQAGKHASTTPTIEDVSDYIVIAGESGIVISASMKDATGYSVKEVTTGFESASETGAVGITVSDGATAKDTGLAVYTGKLALSADITSVATRKVVIALEETPATLSLNYELLQDSAPYGYTGTSAPYFKVTAAVSDSDNVTVSDYTYTYKWYYHNGLGSYLDASSVGTIVSSDNVSTYALPLGYKRGAAYYYAYCEVTATRKDNGQQAVKTTVKNIAATIVQAQLTDVKVTGDGWKYGEARTVFSVNINPENANTTYYYSTSENGTYTTDKPVDVGSYYVKCTLDATENYESYTTAARSFEITQNKLETPSNLTHGASSTAPYGLFSWDAVTGPYENADTTKDPVAVTYHVVITCTKSDGSKSVIVNDNTDATSYDFTNLVEDEGSYEFAVTACVKNDADKANCADSETAKISTNLYIKSRLTADKDLEREYDGTPTTLTAVFSGSSDGVTYQWLFNNTPISGATGNTYQVTEVKETGTYICQATTASEDTEYSTAITVTITKRPVSISWTGGPYTYDGTQKEVTPSLNNVVTKTGAAAVDDISIKTVTGNKEIYAGDAYTAEATALEGTDLGNYTLTGGENVSYDWAIAKRAITMTADSAEKVYDKTALTIQTYEITEGSLATALGDAVTAYTIASTLTDAGSTDNVITDGSVVIKTTADVDVTDSYAITLAKGTLKIKPKPVTITWDYTSPFTYDGSDHEVLATVSNPETGDEVTVAAYSDNKKSQHNDYTATALSLGGKDKDNYTLTGATGTTCAWQILKNSITITSETVSRAYNGTALASSGTSALSVTAGSLSSGDTLSTVTFTASITDVLWAGGVVDSIPNTYTGLVIKNTAGTDVTDEYDITFAEGTLKITPASTTITVVRDISKIYDRQKAALPGTRADGGVTYSSLDNGGLTFRYYTKSGDTYTELTESPTNVGTYYVTASVSGDPNFTDAVSDYKEFTISPKPVALSWSQTNFAFDNEAHSVTATVTNAESGDEVYVASYNADSTLTPPASNTETAAGTYLAAAETLGGADAANYTLVGATNPSTEWQIVKEAQGIQVADVTVTYDANTHEVSPSYAISDSYSFTISYEKLQADGTYAPVTADGGLPRSAGTYRATVSVPETANFAAATATAMVYIKKRPITITSDSASKDYDGEALVATGYTLSGSLAGGEHIDSVTMTAASTITNAGSIANTIDAVNLVDASNVSVAENYEITRVNGTLTVNRIPDTVEIIKNLDKVADGKPVSLDASTDVTRNGTGAITYTYYTKDLFGNYQPLLSAPSTPGTYYVVATEAEAGNYLLSKSPYKEFVISNVGVIITGPDNQPIKVSIQVGCAILKYVEDTIPVGGTYETYFTNLADGVYDVVVESGDYKETRGLTIKDGRIVGSNILYFTVPAIGDGLKNSYLKLPDEQLDIVVKRLDDLFDNPDIFTPEDEEKVDDDQAYVDLALLVDEIDVEKTSDALVGIVSDDGKTVGYTLDMSIEKYIKENSSADYKYDSNIYDTSSDYIIEVAFPLPDEVKDKNGLAVYREHIGAGTGSEYKLEAMKDLGSRVVIGDGEKYSQEGYAIENGMVYIYAHLFSEYVIAYDQDAENPDNEDPADDDPGKKNPKTGDTNRTGGFSALLLLGCVLVWGGFISYKKKKREM